MPFLANHKRSKEFLRVNCPEREGNLLSPNMETVEQRDFIVTIPIHTFWLEERVQSRDSVNNLIIKNQNILKGLDHDEMSVFGEKKVESGWDHILFFVLYAFASVIWLRSAASTLTLTLIYDSALFLFQGRGTQDKMRMCLGWCTFSECPRHVLLLAGELVDISPVAVVRMATASDPMRVCLWPQLLTVSNFEDESCS